MCLQEFKNKEDHVSCILKTKGIIKHLKNHNQTTETFFVMKHRSATFFAAT